MTWQPRSRDEARNSREQTRRPNCTTSHPTHECQCRRRHGHKGPHRAIENGTTHTWTT